MRLGGTSGGAIVAFALAIGISPRDMLTQTKEISAAEASNTFGPWWRVNEYVRKRLIGLADSVSPQAYESANARAFLCVAETSLQCGGSHDGKHGPSVSSAGHPCQGRASSAVGS